MGQRAMWCIAGRDRVAGICNAGWVGIVQDLDFAGMVGLVLMAAAELNWSLVIVQIVFAFRPPAA